MQITVRVAYLDEVPLYRGGRCYKINKDRKTVLGALLNFWGYKCVYIQPQITPLLS